ncbi:hypothetical protein LT493_02715 [Streptomyces tricolor]|nr:hypothetical protein [Streptomyces tricolor]
MSVGAPRTPTTPAARTEACQPWRPRLTGSAACGHAPYRDLLRALFRYAGALRIDSTSWAVRLWWVPQGSPPTDGTYVRYDADAMLSRSWPWRHPRRGRHDRRGPWAPWEPPACARPLERRGVLWHLGALSNGTGGRRHPLPLEALAVPALHSTPHPALPTARLTGDHVELRDRLLPPPVRRRGTRGACRHRRGFALLRQSGYSDSQLQTASSTEGGSRHPCFCRARRLVGIWLPDDSAATARRPAGTWTVPNWLRSADAGRSVLED